MEILVLEIKNVYVKTEYTINNFKQQVFVVQ